VSLPLANLSDPVGPIPASGGIGLRAPHHREVIESRPDIAWFEVHTENYMGGGLPLYYLEAIRRDYPVSLHGVGLSLGSVDGIDSAHLERIRNVAERIAPGLVSDHLSWSMSENTYFGDLLPLPLTEEALDIVCCNVERFQDHLQRRVLVENPSSYLRYRHSTIPEWEFLAAVAERSGCGILCDVNNIFVSASNHGWNPSKYLAALPVAAIGEIHLAGHTLKSLEEGVSIRIDDHGSAVDPAVWALYSEAVARFGPVPTLIEWDNRIPPLEVLIGEADKASAILARADKEDHRADAA
jgi:uncharacterized protein (UPF0276 family)